MATANQSIGSDWELVVAAASTACLVTNIYPIAVEIAVTAADATPPSATLRGHILAQYYAVTRLLLPSGAIWARTLRAADTTLLVIDQLEHPAMYLAFCAFEPLLAYQVPAPDDAASVAVLELITEDTGFPVTEDGNYLGVPAA